MIGADGALPLPMSGTLPPDLQGTLFRVGPARPWGDEGAGMRGPDDEGDGGEQAGALHAVELRDGRAVSYLRQASDADAGVFWHAGSVLAVPEAGIPSQYSRFLQPEEFAGGLTVPIASHVHRLASDGGRVLFGVDDGSDDEGGGGVAAEDGEGIFLRIGEWDALGSLRSAQSVELERATWQHDIGVTAEHVVFIESPTTRVGGGGDDRVRVPFGWVPGAEGWLGVVPRGGDGSGVRWIRLDPCLVTHVLGAYDDPQEEGAVVLYVCRYGVPEAGQPVDLSASVVGPAGLGLTRDRGNARRPGTMARRRRGGRADAGRRALRRVSTDGRPV